MLKAKCNPHMQCWVQGKWSQTFRDILTICQGEVWADVVNLNSGATVLGASYTMFLFSNTCGEVLSNSPTKTT